MSQPTEPTDAAAARAEAAPTDPAAEQQPPAAPAAEPPPSAELIEARRTVQLQTWAATQEVQRAAWDVEAPRTLRERLVYAQQLAAADMLPTRYRDKPANVLLAIEVGDELGLPRMASLRLLTVVDNQPSLGAEGTRAVILSRGHKLWLDQPWCRAHGQAREVCEGEGARGCRLGLYVSAHGIPLEATVYGQRRDEETVHAATFTLAQAQRAGLCTVNLDDAGEAKTVVARSNNNNPLPWEQYTEAMLEARATTTLARRVFADVTGGLAYTDDELLAPAMRQPGRQGTVAPASVVVGPAVPMPDAPAAPVSPQPQPEPAGSPAPDPDAPAIRRTDRPEGWTPADDLDQLGSAWWDHAGATVRRRGPLQLAADRLALELAEGREGIPLPPEDAELQPSVLAAVLEGARLQGIEWGPVVTAEILDADDDPVVAAATAAAEAGGSAGDVARAALEAHADELTGHRQPYVGEGADGCWRSATMDEEEADGLPVPGQIEYDEAATPARRQELLDSAERWRAQAEELVAAEAEADRDAEPEPAPDDGPDPFMGELTGATPAEEEPTADEQAELTRPPREALWADVEAMAQQRGKTVDQLLARLVVAERAELDALSDEALWRWLQAQRAAGLAD